MITNLTEQEIALTIKQTLLIERLELEDISIEEIDNDRELFGEEGLALDSVEALDVIAGIGEEFGINTNELSAEEMKRHIRTVNTLVHFIMDNM